MSSRAIASDFFHFISISILFFAILDFTLLCNGLKGLKRNRQDSKYLNIEKNSSHFCAEARREQIMVKRSWNTEPDQTKLCRQFSSGFPSGGGYGCSCLCYNSTTSHSTTFDAIDHQWPSDLLSNVANAESKIISYVAKKRYDEKFNIKYRYNSSISTLRISFLSHCCITEKEQQLINQISNAQLPNTATIVQFHKLRCFITGPNGAVTILLTLDKISKHALSLRAISLSPQFANRGLTDIKIQRKKSEYGIILGVVPGKFPCKPVLDQINDMIPPGKWTAHPVYLGKFNCSTCGSMIAVS